MMQFYFLSVILNITSGLILIKSLAKKEAEPLDSVEGEETKKSGFIDKIKDKMEGLEVLQSPTFVLVVAVLSLFTGVIKLFKVAGGSPVIFGDFFPAVTGILASLTLLLSLYMSKGASGIKLPKVLETIFVEKSYLVGFVCLIIALLHFIMPGVIFF